MQQKVERDKALAALCLELVGLRESKGVTWWIEHPTLLCRGAFGALGGSLAPPVLRCGHAICASSGPRGEKERELPRPVNFVGSATSAFVRCRMCS